MTSRPDGADQRWSGPAGVDPRHSRPDGAGPYRTGPGATTAGRTGGARAEILARLRATRTAPPPEVPRDYRRAAEGDTGEATLLDLLTDRLTDYRATVLRCDRDGLPAAVAGLLVAVPALVVPPGLAPDWLWAYPGRVLADDTSRPLSVADLDAPGLAVLTGCAVAVASTGTLLLDAGPGQGRRLLSLVPDHHICVVYADQVVADVPEALRRLADPTRPLTLISGPSATSDIELNRVEGVHGPRRLAVVLVGGGPEPSAERDGSAERDKSAERDRSADRDGSAERERSVGGDGVAAPLGDVLDERDQDVLA